MLAFTIGLFSTLHCFGMCGGIVGILTMSLPAELRQQKKRLFLYHLTYNLGRIASYTLAGLLIGLLGQGLTQSLMPQSGGTILRVVSSMLVILLGFYIAGWPAWFTGMAKIEKIGLPIWNKLQPLGQRLLPVQSPAQAFLFGAIWGWLPCGLVYYVLILAAAAPSALESAVYMALFGAGTLIPMLLVGLLAGKLTQIRHKDWVRQLSGGILVVTGLIGLLLLLLNEHSGHAGHTFAH